MTPLRVFIGFDSREPLAFEVFSHSIHRRASGPVSIAPLMLSQLTGVYTRPPNGTTEFALSRFLVPYLSGFEGFSVFADCDMLCLTDIYAVVEDARCLGAAVSVCQHEYIPKPVAKVTGQQTAYPRKNWSSFMVFDNAQCRALTTAYVNTASPADLHRLAWADTVGALPLEDNWLVGEYDALPEAFIQQHGAILHYTLGTPCFPGYRTSDHADLWFAELAAMNAPLDAWIRPEPVGALAAAAGYPWPPRSQA